MTNLHPFFTRTDKVSPRLFTRADKRFTRFSPARTSVHPRGQVFTRADKFSPARTRISGAGRGLCARILARGIMEGVICWEYFVGCRGGEWWAFAKGGVWGYSCGLFKGNWLAFCRGVCWGYFSGFCTCSNLKCKSSMDRARNSKNLYKKRYLFSHVSSAGDSLLRISEIIIARIFKIRIASILENCKC